MNKEYSMATKIILESMVDNKIVRVIKNINVSELVFNELKEFCIDNENIIMNEISNDEFHISIKE